MQFNHHQFLSRNFECTITPHISTFAIGLLRFLYSSKFVNIVLLQGRNIKLSGQEGNSELLFKHPGIWISSRLALLLAIGLATAEDINYMCKLRDEHDS